MLAVSYDLEVCEDCYFLYHYGANDSTVELSEGWDKATAESRLGSILSNGGSVYDHTCADHEWHSDTDELCQYCGSPSSEGDGMTDFSWCECDLCWSRLGGYRFRLAVRDSI